MDKTDPIDVLGRTIYGEARNQGRTGMEAVASVILNRARNPRWWGGPDIISVCLKPWQFSCWNRRDPNLPRLESVTGADPAFTTALAVADDAVNGKLRDPTENADSYFAVGIVLPYWADAAKHTVTIGAHAFYRLELPPV